MVKTRRRDPIWWVRVQRGAWWDANGLPLWPMLPISVASLNLARHCMRSMKMMSGAE